MLCAMPRLCPEPPDQALVPIRELLPQAPQFLPYATEDNFTGQRIYPFGSAFLRYGTLKKLCAVQQELEALGLGLLIWDGFRPLSAQRRLWQACPDVTFVADPDKDSSPHCRGGSVDVTLIDASGKLPEMPSAFDDFSHRARRDYIHCSPEAAANARLLETIMEKHGFTGYENEWWHYNDTIRYPIEPFLEPLAPYEDARQTDVLLQDASGGTAAPTRIPAGHPFQVLAEDRDALYVRFRGQYGYIPK